MNEPLTYHSKRLRQVVADLQKSLTSHECRDILEAADALDMHAAKKVNQWKCGANRSADPPQDCDWPHCGCDPTATKVIESLVEQGWMPVPYSASMPKRERPQMSPRKSKFDYIGDLASYCGFIPSQALFGLVRSQELELILERLADAQDDSLRLHHAYCDLKYPQPSKKPAND